jgi:hypothetical protein
MLLERVLINHNPLSSAPREWKLGRVAKGGSYEKYIPDT